MFVAVFCAVAQAIPAQRPNIKAIDQANPSTTTTFATTAPQSSPSQNVSTNNQNLTNAVVKFLSNINIDWESLFKKLNIK